MFDGNLGLLKVRIKFLVGERDEPFLIVFLLTCVTPWSDSPSKISDSEEDKRSGSEMTPPHEFNDLLETPKKRKKGERRKKERGRKRRGLVVLRSGEEDPGVLVRDADQES
ncbi:hypothetical protein TNCV_2916781 [Trichonephila clavipes]|nr:hypothetical protein TNCV_2916781 [Trichonephila clavipes]